MFKKKTLILSLLKLLFYSTILKPLYDFPSNIFGIQIGFIEKIINFCFLISIAYLIFSEKRIRFYSFSLFLILIILFSAVIGLINGTFFSIFTLSQLYYFLMPLICISAGGLIYQYCGLDFNTYVYKVSDCLFWILFILTLSYIYIHNFTNYWSYFGYSSGLIFSFISIKKTRSNFKLYFGLVIDLFTGKRSTIAMWGFILSLRKPGLLLFFTFIIIILFISFSFLLPQRYIDVLNFSLSDERSMFLATGGRSVEWFGIIDKIKASPISFFTGFGFGTSYEMYDMFQNLWETRHYSHLTPFTYLLICGSFFTTIIYSYLIYFAFKLYTTDYSHMYYYYILMLFLSLSGGGLLAMPLPWVYLGILLSKKQQDNKHLIC